MMQVYKITNSVNGKVYIGCTVDLKHRIKAHFSGKYSGSLLLWKAVAKYGKDKFTVEIVEQFENKEAMYEGEKRYIQQFECAIPNGYNIHLGGKGGKILLTEQQINNLKEHAKRLSKLNIGNTWNKGRKAPQTTKDAVSKAHTGKVLSASTKEKIGSSKIGNTYNLGRKQSVATKEKRSKKLLGRVFSEETKLKMSQAAKLRMLNTHRGSDGRIISKN